MSHYIEQNGLAYLWNHDNTRLELAKWVYHHPEDFEKLIGIIMNEHPELSLEPMSDTDIDNITGVNLNG